MSCASHLLSFMQSLRAPFKCGWHWSLSSFACRASLGLLLALDVRFTRGTELKLQCRFRIVPKQVYCERFLRSIRISAAAMRMASKLARHGTNCSPIAKSQPNRSDVSSPWLTRFVAWVSAVNRLSAAVPGRYFARSRPG
ncbi:hypothetical protein LZ32DRAFT_40019 [Colletotrichum eremochloae]|nr:hypothetical protein LZ32DRAFT_40019 [Colletotrichum eremochloae]